MFSHIYRLVALVAGLALVSACTTTSELTFKDKATGQILDTRWERKDASNPFAPSTAMVFDYDSQAGKVVTEAYRAGATPVEQVSPMAAAGIGAAGLIKAARERNPDVTSVTATGGAGGEASAQGGSAAATGGSANANAFAHSYSVSHGGNQWQIQSQQQLTDVDVKNYVKNAVTNKNFLTAFNSCKAVNYGAIIAKKVSGC